jgi:hypothetical protein
MMGEIIPAKPALTLTLTLTSPLPSPRVPQTPGRVCMVECTSDGPCIQAHRPPVRVPNNQPGETVQPDLRWWWSLMIPILRAVG